jgi:hypothetical protein
MPGISDQRTQALQLITDGPLGLDLSDNPLRERALARPVCVGATHDIFANIPHELRLEFLCAQLPADV